MDKDSIKNENYGLYKVQLGLPIYILFFVYFFGGLCLCIFLIQKLYGLYVDILLHFI